MNFRLRAVKSLAALLYVGPLLAGIGGLGPVMIAPFVAIFLVWLVVLRPEQWPATASEWRTPAAWGAALSQILSQTLLVAVLLAIGRGLGAMAEVPPVVGPFFPLALSFLAIPLCRSLWDANEAALSGVFLDDEAQAAHAPRAAANAAAAVVSLLNLPDDIDDGLAADAVNRTVMASDGAHLRLKALCAALHRPDRSHAALRRALVVWATEPEVVAAGRVSGTMAAAFEIAGQNADLLRLYLPRALALIAAFPARVADFPAPDQIHRVAEGGFSAGPDQDLPSDLRNDLRDGLLALAVAIKRATVGQGDPATAPSPVPTA